jgi:dipeptidyl-peptidase-4
MINNTDSIYSQPVPLEYPKVGETPSSCRVGVVSLSNAQTTWLNIPGDPRQHYLVRMEFIPNTSDLLIQQLNRKQNESKLFVANAQKGTARSTFEEKDPAWVDVYDAGNQYAIDFTNRFIWLTKGKDILWASEKDGWRHLYRISLEGKKETLVTKGNYDFIDLKHVHEKEGYVYFIASPENATQKYLYRTH